MNKYSNHIAIIGSGISGLVLGNTLIKNNIPCIIFEKYPSTSEYGAGISISRNGQNVLDELKVLDKLKSKSGTPKKVFFYSNCKEITSFSVDHITTSRKELHNILLNQYLSFGGEVLFDFELTKIEQQEKLLSFSNGKKFYVKHIAACDGIKSTCRNLLLKNDLHPAYSGYSVWRAILENKTENVEFHLGPNFHIVSYPINKEKISFIAAIKTKNTTEESWRKKGNFSELQTEVPAKILHRYPSIQSNNEIYKWGVYTRKDIDKLFLENITFLGDAAHPIVPFMGQGGCLAIEDGFIYGSLISRFKNDLTKSQLTYKDLRLDRIKNIHTQSLNQAKLNHLKNPILIFLRNFLMKNTNVIHKLTKSIWGYDSKKQIDQI